MPGDAQPTVVYVPLTQGRPVVGGRYDIGGPPERARFYPGAVTLVPNEAGGRWVVERWTIARPPGGLACFQIWLAEATAASRRTPAPGRPPAHHGDGGSPEWRDRVGERVRVRLRPGRGCEAFPHRPDEEGQTGEIVRCDARPQEPTHT